MMKDYVFIGCERRTSAKGNDYFMLYYGQEVDSKKGVGINPIQSRIENDEFAEFSKLDLGCTFKASVETNRNFNGGYTFTLRRYEL